MRFLILIKSDPDTEAGVPKGEAAVAALARYHEDLLRAGVLLVAEELLPSTHGVRVRADGAPVAGPFEEPESVVAGFWLIEVATPAEAVEWVRRCPADGAEVELRPVASGDSRALREQEEYLRARIR